MAGLKTKTIPHRDGYIFRVNITKTVIDKLDILNYNRKQLYKDKYVHTLDEILFILFHGVGYYGLEELDDGLYMLFKTYDIDKAHMNVKEFYNTIKHMTDVKVCIKEYPLVTIEDLYWYESE